MEPAMEGATVTFECPPQYFLTGPNATTCMRNREWEPDLLDSLNFVVIFLVMHNVMEV